MLVVGTSAFAQTGLADIRGTVVDDSGAALPGVTVTATHIDTGTSRTAVTSTTGVFLMPALQVGRYKLQLELDRVQHRHPGEPSRSRSASRRR